MNLFDHNDYGSALVVALSVLVVIYTLSAFGVGFIVGYYIH